jgi:alkylation response protein AidB-like acyl-CoA dehydrogenase
MDFSLQPDTPEISAFRKEVREWLEEHMRGSEHLRWSARWSTRENDEEYKFRRQLANKLGQKRWLFPTYPVEYGGAGLTLDHQFVLETEIDRYGLPLGSIFYTLARLVAPAVLKFGTEEQKKEFLPPMLRAELAVWQVLTEPQGGSDVANCLTRAVRDGDDYIVNGQKIMVGHHLPPDFLWTLVCTKKVANSYLELEHGGGGSVTEHPLFKRLIEHCERKQFDGQSLMEDQDVRDVIADMLNDLDVQRLMGLRNFWHRYVRDPHPYGGPQFFIISVWCA